ncbi:M56 family metallopeptidase [Salinimicrobium sp. GXAS 041]|uniref:M56 family metallopeptidase n=1 Tax=Salinimicrobium sp. GXAS 041 TaxID=3400806 RepID=UPI003C796AAE
MTQYIIEAVIFQLLFLLTYDLLLKKETFFAYNRWYLLLTPIVAIALPLLQFESLGKMVPSESLVMLPEVYLGGAAASAATTTGPAEVSNSLEINWWLVLYLLGALINSILFIRKYKVLKRLFKNRVISTENKLKIIQVPNSNIACTFFNSVFLGDQLKKEEMDQILSHEKIHADQKHSADLLFFELLKIILWFNPLIYIYQARIAVLHEFIADAGVVKTVEKRTYYQQLLNTAFSTENISFINQFFNHSLIKKRIVMLQKSRSKTISKFKFLILLPLMLAMLTYVSCSEQIDDSTVLEQKSTVDSSEILTIKVDNFGSRTPEEETIIKEALNGFKDSDYQVIRITDGTSGLEMTKNAEEGMPNISMIGEPVKRSSSSSKGFSGGDVPFAVIDEVPVFPGCEGLSSNEARKECMSEKINSFVNNNFDVEAAKPYAKPGVNRIYVQFKITKDGSVEEMGIRASSPQLEEEARKVVSQFPKMTPGKQEGQEVGVLYSLPISFQVGE